MGFGSVFDIGCRFYLSARVGRRRRLPKVVSDCLVPIPVRMRMVIWVAPVSAVAVGLLRVPSPMQVL